MSAPKWASEIVARVCDAAGVTVPELTWRRSKDAAMSSGRYMTEERRIIVTAGRYRIGQRLTLLHELGHHLVPDAGHDELFWRAVWPLYRRHGLTSYALEYETRYRAEAGRVAQLLGIRGSRKAVASAAARRVATQRPRNVCPMPAEAAEAQGYRTPHTHYVGTIHRWRDAAGDLHDSYTEPKPHP